MILDWTMFFHRNDWDMTHDIKSGKGGHYRGTLIVARLHVYHRRDIVPKCVADFKVRNNLIVELKSGNKKKKNTVMKFE